MKTVTLNFPDTLEKFIKKEHYGDANGFITDQKMVRS